MRSNLQRAARDVALVGRDVAALEETAALCAAARPGAVAHLFARRHRVKQRSIRRSPQNRWLASAASTVAVANAGQSIDALLLRLKAETIDQMLDVNLKSAFYLCARGRKADDEAALRFDRARVTSIVGMTGNAGQAAYAASKAGLLGLCKSVAKELGSRNIRVNAVAPGLIETAMTEKMPDAATGVS